MYLKEQILLNSNTSRIYSLRINIEFEFGRLEWLSLCVALSWKNHVDCYEIAIEPNAHSLCYVYSCEDT